MHEVNKGKVFTVIQYVNTGLMYCPAPPRDQYTRYHWDLEYLSRRYQPLTPSSFHNLEDP